MSGGKVIKDCSELVKLKYIDSEETCEKNWPAPAIEYCNSIYVTSDDKNESLKLESLQLPRPMCADAASKI